MPSRLHLGLAAATLLLALIFATPIGTTLRHRILPTSSSQKNTSSASPSTPPTKSDRPPTRPKPTYSAIHKLLRETILPDIHLKDLTLEECLAALNAELKRAGVDTRDVQIVLEDSFPQPLADRKCPEVSLQNVSVLSFLYYFLHGQALHYRIGDGLVEIYEVSPSNGDPVPAWDPDSTMTAIQDKLDSIIIPLIAFDETTLEEAVDFLRARSIELDNATLNPGLKGMNVIILSPPLERAPTNPSLAPPSPIIKRWQARGLTLTQTLDGLTWQTGTTWSIDPYAVVIRPKSAPPFSE